ncbi:hypothetical protein OG921_14425 [Aldersonia sp. NBC_00410]|uniref:hypothetical protein n=1 Tax=Aldersonia sp. NBC_00410 TaxID=2975954 RepID=UPI00224EFBB2|nr:hypothetical protein [Aldersonia sp. NBC_00410]MCX5044362.1 hypothetical protein [Aldersonia sp. NBC_00410]
MQKIARVAATSAIAVTAIGLAAGTANAAPALAPPAPDTSTITAEILPGVHYAASGVDRSIALDTPIGSLRVLGDQFQVKNSLGGIVAGAPEMAAPAAVTTVAASVPTPVPAPLAGPAAAPAVHEAAADMPLLHQVDATADFNSALAVAATQTGLAISVGTLTGGAIGLGVGCVAGAFTGGFFSLPALPAVPIMGVLGCIAGAGTGAGIGGIVGGIAAGVPVGIASGVQMYNTLHAAGDI